MTSKPHDLIGAILTGQLQTLELSEEEARLLRRRERDLARKKRVLAVGIEPTTTRLQGEGSTKLSYASKSND